MHGLTDRQELVFMEKQRERREDSCGKTGKGAGERSMRERILSFLLIVLMALLSGGCRESVQMASEVQTVEEYTDAQILLIATTEMNRYRAVYTDQIWEVPLDDKGTTFQSYLLGEVRSFLEEVKMMNLMADEREIGLSSQERERIQELTEDYYESLTEADKNYTRISQEEVYGLYAEYYRANKLVEELTKDIDLEISDSEAKVITVQELRVSDSNEAQEIHTRVMTEGVDFSVVARAVSEDSEIEKSIGRGERSQEYEDAVFSLMTGEIGPIIRDGDAFCIVKCIDEYDEEATLERKQKLALQRKNLAFHKIYDAFVAEHSVDLGGDIWERITFSEENTSTTADFFEWYRDYMGQ